MHAFTVKPSSHDVPFVLPNTQFFEVSSAIAGATYGVWVSTPPGYEPTDSRRYPVIVTADGNLAAPITIPFIPLVCPSAWAGEVIHPIRPYVQVTVGYVGAEAADPTTRYRDLLPPGEPAPPYFVELKEAWVADGTWTPEMGELALAKLTQGRGDAFLRFLTHELMPWVADQWRVEADGASFFGDSLGGLFAIWMALQRPAGFRNFAAGSPGVATAESTIFGLLQKARESDADFSGRHLHLSIAEREISAPTYFQMAVGEQYVHLLARLGHRPLRGLTVTTHTVPYETHITALPANYFSFLRACFSARP